MFSDFPTQPPNPYQICTDLQNWQDRWELRFALWLAKDPEAEQEEILQHIPDLVALLSAALCAPHWDTTLLLELCAAGQYVMNEMDLIPESQSGVNGLLDDAVVMSTPLRKIAHLNLGWVYQNWTGQADIGAVLTRIEQYRDQMLLGYAISG